MELLWLWILLGIIGLLIILVGLSFLFIHLALYGKSWWCTDNKPVQINLTNPEDNAPAYKTAEYIANNGEPVEIIADDGVILRGKFFPAKNAKRTVVGVHGYRGKPERDFCLGGQWLFDQGESNVLIITHRAHGNSGGKYITMGVKERDDIHKWVDYISKRVDTPIYLWGISMGAATILMSLYKEYPSQVRAILADCGYTSPYEQFHKEVAHYSGKPLATLLLFFANIYCKLFAKFSLKDADARDALKNNKLPVLFIHGLADGFVLPINTKKNYEACTSEKDIILVEGATHGMSFYVDKETYTKKAWEYLNK